MTLGQRNAKVGSPVRCVASSTGEYWQVRLSSVVSSRLVSSRLVSGGGAVEAGVSFGIRRPERRVSPVGKAACPSVRKARASNDWMRIAPMIDLPEGGGARMRSVNAGMDQVAEPRPCLA